MVDVSADSYYFYHYDGLGSAIALSNISGEIVEWYDYDVFGEPKIILFIVFSVAVSG